MQRNVDIGVLGNKAAVEFFGTKSLFRAGNLNLRKMLEKTKQTSSILSFIKYTLYIHFIKDKIYYLYIKHLKYIICFCLVLKKKLERQQL